MPQTKSADGVISLEPARTIMKEEGIDYTDEELEEVLAVISEIILRTTNHYERVKKGFGEP